MPVSITAATGPSLSSHALAARSRSFASSASRTSRRVFTGSHFAAARNARTRSMITATSVIEQTSSGSIIHPPSIRYPVI